MAAKPHVASTAPRDLPEGWRMVRFAELASNVNDRVDYPSLAGVDRYVGLEHLDSGNLKIRRWGSPSDVEATKLRFQSGDLIFGRRRAYQRKLGIAEFEGICSAHALVLRARSDTVDPQFLPFLMQSEVFQERAESISVGSLSPTINWRTLAVQEFPLPPLDEQRRIAEVLWAAEESAERWRTVEGDLNAMGDLISLQAFSQDAGATASIGDLCDLLTVGIVVRPASYYVDDGVPALRSLNILPDRFSLDQLVYISDEGHRLHEKSRLRTGDVVVVRTGRPGDAAVVGPDLDGSNCIDLIVARPSKRVRSAFLSRFLNSAAGRSKILSGSAGTAQQHLNVTQIRRIRMPVPDLLMQDQIISELAAIDAQINACTEQIALTRRLKADLLHTLLKGSW
ncbi:MAG: restriction endonuclease subunit S [Chloroflexi bacterium]|nr:restriction endonuclease subunit S [Chloroflexota bacterium]